jgi:class I fructose-bisphosphate aldolase
MKSPNLNGLIHNGKSMILAYDQGFEHGPMDFNIKNIDPQYIMDIALEGRYNALAVQTGIAEKYHLLHYREIPMLIKLNAKTRYDNQDPLSSQHTSVAHAANLGAKAVGYTIYLGSTHEQKMFAEFGKITEQAHSVGLPVVCWMYPRGPSIHNETSTDTLAYGARVAMELGSDIVKLKFNDDVEGMRWVIKSAGRTKVVAAGGSKENDIDFLKTAERALRAGATGVAVGRNIWQNERPLEISKALKDIIFNNLTAEEAFAKIKK